MLNKRRKLFHGICPTCHTEKKLRFIGENEMLGILWLKCNTCRETHYYLNEKINDSGQILTAKEKEITERSYDDLVEYSVHKTYGIGQRIHHNIFMDEGKILDKRSTDDNHHVIVVRFDHAGTKNLIEAL